MTEKEMRCVKALRICHSNEDCRDCEFMESDRCEKSCVNILFEDSADIIESLSERLEAAQPKWISVKDELPEVSDVVLVIASGKPRANVELHNAMLIASYWGDEGWIADGFEGWDKLDVTHWMPLPEPPKEGT
jgi:hypothetical protein